MRWQIETNLFGPMNVTRAALPILRKQRAGHIITLSSSAGLIGQEFCVAYAASKFGAEGWMESLRYDVEPSKIHTTVVEPGFFRTELLVDDSTIWPEPTIDDYAERITATVAAWKSMNGRQTGDPAKLARALLTIAGQSKPPAALRRGRRRHRRRDSQGPGTPRTGRSLPRTRRQPGLRRHPRLNALSGHPFTLPREQRRQHSLRRRHDGDPPVRRSAPAATPRHAAGFEHPPRQWRP
ncbi:SDR family NAD(P)-dependent oxidoreductase [Streptomyces sp. NPDC088551]|uniref:SDR family NAD(P)-dependent oxidoreductase n=1 Tax=Streptomyces sp. NPDC088551 TaxID=3365863 RepID=UPI00380A86A5